MKILLLIFITIASYAQRPPLEIIPNPGKEQFIIPDQCFHKIIDINGFKGYRLDDLLRAIGSQSSVCGVLIIYSPMLVDSILIRVRKTKGTPLELIEDALRDTTLQITISLPRSICISRYIPKTLTPTKNE
jgi:hypothetical protein